jgi:DNA transformation protein
MAGRGGFRTSQATRPRYEQVGSRPLSPSAKQTLRSYYQIPADVLEDRSLLTQWAMDAAGS